MPRKDPVLQTTTDEPYLPTRLVYAVHQPEAVRRWFEKHPTMAWDPELRRWTFRMFYADGPQPFEQVIRIREMLALLQHKSPTPIRPFEVFEKLFETQADPPDSPA